MKLIIPAAIERRLNAYVQAVDSEIAGMGELEMREDGNLWVTDIAIYNQEVTGGTADLSPQALAMFQTELIKAGKSPKNWYLWWHSHHTMGAFFSTTDTGTIGTSTEFDHLMSLVVNQRRDRKARFDTHMINGLPLRMTVDNVAIEIGPDVTARNTELDQEIYDLAVKLTDLRKERDAADNSVPEDVVAEVAAKVKVKSYKISGFGYPKNSYKGGDGLDRFLDKPFDESWSRSRKKNGADTTISDAIRNTDLDEDEVELLLSETEKLIRGHVANGTGGSSECEELRADLIMYTRYLDGLKKRVENNEWDSYWNGKKWVDGSDYEDPYDYTEYDDDGFGLPRLPAPYQYSMGKDDERA